MEERDYTIEIYAKSAELVMQSGFTLSPLGEKVALVLGVLSGGMHNYRHKAKVNWGDTYCIEAPISCNLSTHDPESLLVLIAASAGLGLRLTLDIRGRSIIAQFHDINERGLKRQSSNVFSDIQERMYYWHGRTGQAVILNLDERT